MKNLSAITEDEDIVTKEFLVENSADLEGEYTANTKTLTLNIVNVVNADNTEY